MQFVTELKLHFSSAGGRFMRLYLVKNGTLISIPASGRRTFFTSKLTFSFKC